MSRILSLVSFHAVLELTNAYDKSAEQMEVYQIFPDDGVLIDVLPDYLSHFATALMETQRTAKLFNSRIIQINVKLFFRWDENIQQKRGCQVWLQPRNR